VSEQNSLVFGIVDMTESSSSDFNLGQSSRLTEYFYVPQQRTEAITTSSF
jgi:hypothetical protein